MTGLLRDGVNCIENNKVKNINVKNIIFENSSVKNSNVKNSNVKNSNGKNRNVKNSNVKNRNVKNSSVKNIKKYQKYYHKNLRRSTWVGNPQCASVVPLYNLNIVNSSTALDKILAINYIT